MEWLIDVVFGAITKVKDDVAFIAEVVVNLVGDDVDDLVDGVAQLLPLCRCCTRSSGCLDAVVVVDLCCCSCLMMNWKMYMIP